MGRLLGKTALVVGGTHGMGLATAKALRAEGVQVLVTGADPANVQKARHDLEGRGDAIRSDVTSRDDLAVTLKGRTVLVNDS